MIFLNKIEYLFILPVIHRNIFINEINGILRDILNSWLQAGGGDLVGWGPSFAGTLIQCGYDLIAKG